jgi:hypothetical protein
MLLLLVQSYKDEIEDLKSEGLRNKWYSLVGSQVV